MHEVPYEQQIDGKACALACYTMVAQHFFSDITFEDIAQISEWEPGYVAWPFKFWLWILGRGILIENYDVLDYKSWGETGVAGLKESVPEAEFNYYAANTKDLDSYSGDVHALMQHINFYHHWQNPTVSELRDAIKNDYLCEVVMSAGGSEDFALHRVVVFAIDNDNVTFHDPSPKGGPNRIMPIADFKKAWLEDLSEPELCIYKRAAR